jgi:alkylated DNA repair dioxygenase AlkB
MQGSLFASSIETIGFDASFRSLERIELPQGAWVDRQPGWVTASDELFARVRDSVDWKEGFERIRGLEVPRPRLVASFNSAELPKSLEVIREMSAVLSERYQVSLDRISANLYRDGRDSVAWHGDRVARNLPEATVATVSLGEPRPFRMRPKGGGKGIGWLSGHGDLTVMGGSCQRTHDHSVPKVANAGQRIAVMFRHSYD